MMMDEKEWKRWIDEADAEAEAGNSNGDVWLVQTGEDWFVGLCWTMWNFYGLGLYIVIICMCVCVYLSRVPCLLTTCGMFVYVCLYIP